MNFFFLFNKKVYYELKTITFILIDIIKISTYDYKSSHQMITIRNIFNLKY